uniref:Uncharacterized protein n=1 Tax=Arabidopsis thaliana TaxID=3702 RepID=Q0WM04_ARATH|nr:hypothetical protein [Arabidopsis thaliana]
MQGGIKAKRKHIQREAMKYMIKRETNLIEGKLKLSKRQMNSVYGHVRKYFYIASFATSICQSL